MTQPKLIYFDAEACGRRLPDHRMSEPEKKAAREALVEGYLPAWARSAEKNIPGEAFFGGAKRSVGNPNCGRAAPAW